MTDSRSYPDTAGLADELTKWVEQYALKVCPPGCLPLPAQEREINLFARIAIALRAPAQGLKEPAILEMAKMIDGEAWIAVQDGRDNAPGSMWHLRRDWAKRKAHAIAASLPDLLALSSTMSGGAAK